MQPYHVFLELLLSEKGRGLSALTISLLFSNLIWTQLQAKIKHY